MLKQFKPTTKTRRHTIRVDRKKLLTNDKPYKQLLVAQKSKAARNNQGKITVRHQGGGVKHHYRIVDFKRDIIDISAKISTIEYDPNRSAFISLVTYENGEKRYIIAPDGVVVGQKIVSSSNAEAVVGNCLPLKVIPVGIMVHNVEGAPGKGAKFARSAGASLLLQGFDGKGYAQLKMPSGEIRLVKEDCRATVGTVSNSNHINETYGKAGYSRRKGRRPSVRGMAMSWGHPHAGGEAKSQPGNDKNIYGHHRGKKTRKKKSHTNKFIVERRKKNK
jgi:large subunit ribosomal protein L2